MNSNDEHLFPKNSRYDPFHTDDFSNGLDWSGSQKQQSEEPAGKETSVEQESVEQFIELEMPTEIEPTGEPAESLEEPFAEEPRQEDVSPVEAEEQPLVVADGQKPSLSQCIDLRLRSGQVKKSKIIIESTFPIVDNTVDNAANRIETDDSTANVSGFSAVHRPVVGEANPENPSIEPLYVKRFASKNPALIWDDFGDLPLDMAEPNRTIEEPTNESAVEETPDEMPQIDPETLQNDLDDWGLHTPEVHEVHESHEIQQLDHFHPEEKFFETEESQNFNSKTLENHLDEWELHIPDVPDPELLAEFARAEFFHPQDQDFEEEADQINLEELQKNLDEWELHIPELSEPELLAEFAGVELFYLEEHDFEKEEEKTDPFDLEELRKKLDEWGLHIPELSEPDTQNSVQNLEILEYYEPEPHESEELVWSESYWESRQDRNFFEYLSPDDFVLVSPLEPFELEIDAKPIALEGLREQGLEEPLDEKNVENEQIDENKENIEVERDDKSHVDAHSEGEGPPLIPFPDAQIPEVKPEPSEPTTGSMRISDSAILPRTATSRILSPEERAMPILEVRNMSVQFGQTLVLKKIDMKVRRGETVAVIGESGCGKTVLLKTLIGLLTPIRGDVLFDGVDINTLPEKELTKQRIRYGFVFQQAALFDSMSIMENIAFPLRQHTDYTDDEVMDFVVRLLEEVGLPKNVLEKKPAELSGGMRKRVGFARALALGPEIMLYDEPTTGLDPIMSDVINELMLRAKGHHDVSAVVVTHDMNSAKKVADRIIMLYPMSRLKPKEPQIIFDGTPEEIEKSTDPRVSQFLRGEARDRIYEKL